ncbi:bifunctional adenosylcobinamide kinase/adenosylcobinamide-phosphate guanylyltransferase [Cohnella sp.]|uniref:bifunctional adenosylcobinamide kinase/adenosylcobinamide-phosphate guanylyltransferase n=1 Tax=Cohnella sp. TaxID=1883426 RepID=UPI00356911D9
MVVLVTGGARSGKSTFAERYAAHLGSEGKYIATAHIYDEEMRTRVRRHLERREHSGFAWETAEVPYDLSGILGAIDNDKVVLVDCLTLWLSNWLISYEKEKEPEGLVWNKIDELIRTLSALSGTIILVTNEVGDGIVPEYALGRQFRDLAGVMNQRIAAISQQVFLVTAGIPMEMKSREFKFGDRNG